ncbi:MAG: hypothetical protein HFI64_15250 [Lachnospiraceae bacterium]|nr:hypothetical protein [Lachnospiraceae bacterium]
MQELENHMIVDWLLGEVEYGIPDRGRLARQREAYDEAERNGIGNDFEGEDGEDFIGDW